MTIVTGRRRIGKTRLIAESLRNEEYIYFFVARKEESLLCQEFVEHIQEKGISVFGELNQFKDVFALLLNVAQKRPITLVIDEFQDFFRVNPSIYSEIQDLWDRNKEKTQMNLVLSGSVYSLMRKIFEDAKEPLFGRADEQLFLNPFSVHTQKKILLDHNPSFNAKDLLCFYMYAGGIPKYIEQFVNKKCLTKDDMLSEMIRANSLFLEEGKHVLIEEFGKEYGIYFSILSLIASTRTSRSRIESLLKRDVGGYLGRLEEDYQIIQKTRPIFSKPGTRNTRYTIRDNFLNFWFRFIYKNRGAIEIRNFPYVRQIIERDFSTVSGHFLENYIRDQLAESLQYSTIGSYWERGNKNEIDIVAINELEKRALIAEVKMQSKHISLPKLQSKTHDLTRKLGGYEITYKGFSLKDILLD